MYGDKEMFETIRRRLLLVSCVTLALSILGIVVNQDSWYLMLTQELNAYSLVLLLSCLGVAFSAFGIAWCIITWIMDG